MLIITLKNSCTLLFTSKSKKFPWERKHDKAFEKLKEELSSETILAFYEPNKDLQLWSGVSQKDSMQ